MDFTPKKINDFSELWETCFEAHGTSYLLLSSDEAHINAIAAIRQRLRATKTPMRIYSTELFVGKESVFDGSAVPTLIAVNGVKGWYKKYDGTFGEKEVSAWMDAVKMGEGKKLPISPDKVKELFGVSDGSESKTSSSSEWPTTETATTTASEVSLSIVSETVESKTSSSSEPFTTETSATTPAERSPSSIPETVQSEATASSITTTSAGAAPTEVSEEGESQTALSSETSMTETATTTSDEAASTALSEEGESKTAASSATTTQPEVTALKVSEDFEVKTTSSTESSTTETETSTMAGATSTVSEEGVKEVFGDGKEKVHDEL